MRHRRGISILEVFVVLGILSLLLALLLPAVQSARERAREAVCKNNLHQLNLAFAQFTEAHKRMPAPAPPGQVGGWMVEILPFMEQAKLKDSIPDGLPITNAPSQLLQLPRLYRCPRRTTLDGGSLQSIEVAHYVLVPVSGRESFYLFDAPINLYAAWLSSPELPYDNVIAAEGPHHGGFHFASGFQQGVDFMLDGRKVR